MWITFDATSDIKQKSVTVKQDNDELCCIVLYVNQTQLPKWYMNNLLSDKNSPLLGNVLLVLPKQDWPKELLVSLKWLRLLMQPEEEKVEGQHRIRGNE